MVSALLSAIGIDSCTGPNPVSGDCNPIGAYSSDCTNKVDCGCMINKQAICATIADTFGKLFRNCDSAMTSKGEINKRGGCNSEKFKLKTPVECVDLEKLDTLLLRYMDLIGCDTSDDIENTGGIMVNDLVFNIVNSYCKEDAFVGMNSAHYPHSYSIPASEGLASLTLEIIHAILDLIKKYFDNMGEMCDIILAEMQAIDLDQLANDITIRNQTTHNIMNILEVDLISSYVDGDCRATQDTVFVHSTKTIVQNCVGAVNKLLPSIERFQIQFNSNPKKTNLLLYIYITIGIVSIVIVLFILKKLNYRVKNKDMTIK
jgi:hypothetical protein